ncbi:MAG: HNH endonuclease [Candidatus Neomicrothrix subdominans]
MAKHPLAWRQNRPDGWTWRKLRQAILDRDYWQCHWCRQHVHPTCGGGTGRSYCDRCATVDHVVAKVDGGSDHPTNLVASCRECNRLRSQGRDPQAKVVYTPSRVW